MNGFISVLVMLLVLSTAPPSARQHVVECVRANQDPPLTLDPASPFWSDARAVTVEKNRFGKIVPNFHATVRTRWTEKNIYLLFVSPYDELHLKPSPTTQRETNELWNWDVAEVFIGIDFKDIKHYKEFEISPQGEWIDLDIDLHKPHHEEGWVWNSGFEVSALIDRVAHVWYGAMRIPYSAIDTRRPAAGNVLRINLFRSQGPVSSRYEIAWRAPMSDTFHVPERFGLLELIKKEQ